MTPYKPPLSYNVAEGRLEHVCVENSCRYSKSGAVAGSSEDGSWTVRNCSSGRILIDDTCAFAVSCELYVERDAPYGGQFALLKPSDDTEPDRID